MRPLAVSVIAFALLAPNAEAADTRSEWAKASGAVAAGAVGGGAAYAAIGSVGVAAAGTAVSVGFLPFVAIGAVVGVAGYGVYRLVAPESATVTASPTTGKPLQKP
jgi:hypothetical protein